MRVTDRQLAQAFIELLKEGKEAKGILEKNFFNFLQKKRLLGRSAEILKAVEQYSNEQESVLPVTVATAHPLGSSEQKKVAVAVKKLFPDKHPLVSFLHRPTLLGGIRIETENTLYDATVRRTLQKLAQTL